MVIGSIDYVSTGAQFIHNTFRIINIFFIFQLVLQTCPEVHRDRSNLHFHANLLFVIREKDRNFNDQMKAAVTIHLRIFNIIFAFDQFNVILRSKHIRHFVNVINKSTDDANPCHI